jgi:hypothetical protein
MSNIRGPTTHGPECFYHSDDSDSNDDSTSPTPPIPDKSRRDIRDEIPLALKRNYVLETASDMALRIKYLEKPSQGSEDYERVIKLQNLLVWLGNMSSDNPKLDLQEYIEIWTTIGDGLEAANGLLFQVITLSEERHIKHIKWNAECVWGVAMLNAAVRKLEPTIIETSDPNEYEDTKKSGSGERLTFEGNLGALSGKIHGLLLDSKDFWPDGKRWFNKNEEEKILEAVWMVHCEGKRRHQRVNERISPKFQIGLYVL